MIDRLLSATDRLSYRRMLAWAVTVGLFVAGLVDQTAFMTITAVFMGGEAVEKGSKAIAQTLARRAT